MDYSLPDSSVLGILQVRILEWVAISFSRRIVWRFLIKLKLEVLNDPAIPLLGVYLEENMIQKDTCTPMFIAALFAIAKTWKQPKCPSTEEWIKKMGYIYIYIYTMEYCLAIKKNEIMPFCSNMDGPRDCHTEWS